MTDHTADNRIAQETILAEAKAYASKKYEKTDTTTFAYLQQDACVDGYLQAYRALSSLQPGGLRWVKVSDRLPPRPGSPEYHFRVDGFHKVNGNFHHSISDETCEGDVVFSVHGGGLFDDYVIPPEKFCNLEWLEETESPSSIEGEEKKGEWQICPKCDGQGFDSLSPS